MKIKWIIGIIAILWILWEALGFYMESQYAKTSHYADAVSAYVENEYPRTWVNATEDIKLFKTGYDAIVTSVKPLKDDRDVLVLKASIPVRWNYHTNSQKTYKKTLKKSFHARIDGDTITIWDPDMDYRYEEGHYRTQLGKPRDPLFKKPKPARLDS
ncbi:MAG: hypothetical protein U1C33_00785 [Candidatus Cloacimonadaceae bacterium]|nr:hypothetical protein [Candidatus Cloacimonadaceae bacterium]